MEMGEIAETGAADYSYSDGLCVYLLDFSSPTSAT